MDLEQLTHLDWGPGRPPTTLWLTGDVGHILNSTCVWGPGVTGGEPGAVRAVDLADDDLPFGLGAAAFGEPPARAVRQLGEYVLVDGRSWWTPAVRPVSSRYEPPGSPALTPFLFRWDAMASAVARLESAAPVPLACWYEHLMRRLTKLGACPTGMIAVEVVADIPARLIVDKQLARAPLREHRPADERLITDEAHLDEFFVRNGASGAYGGGVWCTVVMVGVAADPHRAAVTWGDDVLRRAFYTTPGVSESATLIHHTHALVTKRLHRAEPTGAAVERFTGATDAIASGAHRVQATHIESDTQLYNAEARVGAIGEIVTS
ncbi:MAG TPA: hypothetical protein VFM55_06080 [Micromonosporaceae bacterium]|nr:hypothetical protein [Micromonosporaceae bacterium]